MMVLLLELLLATLLAEMKVQLGTSKMAMQNKMVKVSFLELLFLFLMAKAMKKLKVREMTAKVDGNTDGSVIRFDVAQ